MGGLIDAWENKPFTLIGGNGICQTCGSPALNIGSFMLLKCDNCLGGPDLVSCNNTKPIKEQTTLEVWL